MLIDASFPNLRDALAAAEEEAALHESSLEALIAEFAGDEGLVDEANTGTSKSEKKTRANRIVEIANEPEFIEELEVLKQLTSIVEKFDLAKTQVKTYQTELTNSLLVKYRDLDEAEVKRLSVIKWESALLEAVVLDRSRISQSLSDRISQLGERYNETLPSVVALVEDLQRKMTGHLALLGLELK